mmetsp:Transcript_55148/g.124163  ORF Transcript_55148/g.124163 Transcript_55148/m.124163 type:complete len:271 (+) Transcript_55148:817-1629(+)
MEYLDADTVAEDVLHPQVENVRERPRWGHPLADVPPQVGHVVLGGQQSRKVRPSQGLRPAAQQHAGKRPALPYDVQVLIELNYRVAHSAEERHGRGAVVPGTPRLDLMAYLPKHGLFDAMEEKANGAGAEQLRGDEGTAVGHHCALCLEECVGTYGSQHENHVPPDDKGEVETAEAQDEPCEHQGAVEQRDRFLVYYQWAHTDAEKEHVNRVPEAERLGVKQVRESLLDETCSVAEDEHEFKPSGHEPRAGCGNVDHHLDAYDAQTGRAD